jgi:predicted DNA binding protein
LDSKGFLFTCRVPENRWKEITKFLRKHYRQVQRGTVKVSHEGHGIILVKGDWVRDGEYLWNDSDKGYLSKEREFAKLMAIYHSKNMFFLRPPEISCNRIRFALVGDSESLRALEKILSNVNLPYNVKNLSGFEKSIDSAFDRLTPQQMKVLRRAYVEGYYSVPRKISTEQLANLLKMEKGNVGEHLRRAEKNIMDFLMTE